MLNKIYIFIFVFILNGCSSIFYKANDLINPSKGTDFSLISNKLSVDICPSITSFQNNLDIYITDFVNISNLENASQLGFLLSNELKVAILSNCSRNLKIKELTLGKNIKIGKQGVKILSRDLSKLKAKTISQSGRIITGTYTITSQKLIIFIKVIELKTGNILYSKSTSTNITKEILELEGLGTTVKVYPPMVL